MEGDANRGVKQVSRDYADLDYRPGRSKAKLFVWLALVGVTAGAIYLFFGRESAPIDTGVRIITLQPQVPLQESMEEQLARLRAECAKEVRSEKAGEKASCNEYARLYALHEGVASPGVATTPQPQKTDEPKPDAAEPERARIMVKYCDEFEYESVKHQECRAQEGARLRRRCEELRAQSAAASDADRKTILPYQMAYCHEAERY
jgi:hypothetical protein